MRAPLLSFCLPTHTHIYAHVRSHMCALSNLYRLFITSLIHLMKSVKGRICSYIIMRRIAAINIFVAGEQTELVDVASPCFRCHRRFAVETHQPLFRTAASRRIASPLVLLVI